MRLRTILVFLIIGPLATCNSIVPEQEFVAFLGYGSVRPPNVTVPDTVIANTSFEVVIKPELGCGSDAIPALVQITGMTADVTARAFLPEHQKGVGFTCEGRIKDKSIGSVTFASVGNALVRVHGRDSESGKLITLSYPVIVRNQ